MGGEVAGLMASPSGAWLVSPGLRPLPLCSLIFSQGQSLLFWLVSLSLAPFILAGPFPLNVPAGEAQKILSLDPCFLGWTPGEDLVHSEK